jgi:hypothetical protein
MDKKAYLVAKDAMKSEDYKAALRSFRIVLDSIGEHDESYNLVLSQYGLAQVLNDDDNGLLLCREAASSEVFDGNVFLNLACAEWHSNNRKRAIDAIRHGIKIDADNEQLNRACAKLDCRRKCCFGFLPRGHRLNRIFGRLFRKPSEQLSIRSLLY